MIHMRGAGEKNDINPENYILKGEAKKLKHLLTFIFN